MMMFFRCDGSGRLGLGHIVRCMAFAQGLKRQGIGSLFITRATDETITDSIRSGGYAVCTIPGGSDFAEDARITLQHASWRQARIIVTDISNSDMLARRDDYCEYLGSLKKHGMYIITIDGLGGDCLCDKACIASDMAVIPYYGAEQEAYKRSTSTVFLLGPAYFIFRPEFIAAAGQEKPLTDTPTNILVSMGGTDPFCYTAKAARALGRLQKPGMHIRIIIGKGFDPAAVAETRQAVKDFPGTYELKVDCESMAEQMLWADLAVIASGLTVYEAAVTGTPALIISQYHHHAEIMERYAGSGAAVHLGWGETIDEAHIAHMSEQLLYSPGRRHAMSCRGRELVDGRGLDRIISRIPKEYMTA